MLIAQAEQETYRLITDPVGILLALYSVAVVALILERLLSRMKTSKLSARRTPNCASASASSSRSWSISRAWSTRWRRSRRPPRRKRRER